MRAILLAPLPFREPERLVRVSRETPSGPRQSSSGGDFLEFQRTSKTLSGLTSYFESTGNLVGFGAPQRVKIARVSSNFFDLLGIRPMMGRTFTAAEDTYNAAEVGLVSEGAWQRLFGGDRDVLGRTVKIDGQTVQLIGVVSARTRFPDGVELWLPAQYSPGMLSDDNRGASFMRLIGRLAPGVSLEQANAEFAAMSRSISERFPEARAETVSSLSSFSAALVGDVRRPLWVLLGAVVLVLLVACTNVAALLLGRMMARENELTIRAALGAGRGRLIRQLLTESTTLGVIGAAVGVVLAVGLVRMLVALAPDIPRISEVRVNAPVLLFSIALGIVTGLVFGLVPAWQASKRDLQSQLRGAGRGLAGTPAVRTRAQCAGGRPVRPCHRAAQRCRTSPSHLYRHAGGGSRLCHDKRHDVHRDAATGWDIRRGLRRDRRPAPIPARGDGQPARVTGRGDRRGDVVGSALRKQLRHQLHGGGSSQAGARTRT